MTDTQATRTAAMFAEIAREPVDVEEIKGTVYALGSEVACLRLLANKQRWFFALDK